MKKLLRKLSETIVRDQRNVEQYNKYRQMQDTEGWEVYRGYLNYLRGTIALEILGEKFTKLPPVDKDVQQRAYAMVDELILFFLDPLREAQKQAKFKWHNKLMEATVKRSDQKGKENGRR